MHSPIRDFGRLGLTTLLAVTVFSSSGCSHLQFGSYASFDAWYVGRDDVLRVDQLGFTGMDGTFPGYVINDLVIRTPVYIVYEATWLVLVPVALPYYGVKSLSGGSDNEEPPEEAATPEVTPESPVGAEDTADDDLPASAEGAPEGAEGAPPR
jgi:hypothetical protein